jgi:amino acid permease
MGFWLNKWPFAVYLSTWGIVLIALPLFLVAIFESLNLKRYASSLITPFLCLLLPCFIAHFMRFGRVALSKQLLIPLNTTTNDMSGEE